MRIFLLSLLAGIALGQAAAQAPTRPKLVIGIVVDQMRYDFLYRYQSQYVAGGFNLLLRDGFSCENTHYNYAPTYTAPGHAAIYTGTTPAVNGIIGNEWWDPEWGKNRYVTTDTTVRTVPFSGTKKAGQHSPRVLLSSTVTDELRLSNNFQSKVIGVCLKDRASILPAGHIPNGSFWFDDKTGNWITSSYYQPRDTSLPQWVQDFNQKRLPDAYLSKPWEKLVPDNYTESFANWDKYDDGQYSKTFNGGFPYNLPALKQKDGYGVIRFTPFGNTLTLDFARAAIENNDLGADNIPDFLCISFSCTDYCGHQFGLHAAETEDVYLRLDRDLAAFFEYVNQKFGKDNVLVFLTADHGAAETPAHLKDLKIPAGVMEESTLEQQLENAITAQTGLTANFIQAVNNQQVWFNMEAIADFDQDPYDIADIVMAHLRTVPGVYDVFTRDMLNTLGEGYPFAAELRRGIHPRRSGDIVFQLDPAWHGDDVLFKVGGTTHGSTYAYDTHVPLLWYGWKVKHGETFDAIDITDIAPTLSAMLRIMEPNGNTGKVIQSLMR